MTARSDISKNIKARRKQLRLTQDQLAKKAKRTIRYISILETSPEKNVTLDTLESIAAALDCEVFDLLQPAGRKKRPIGLDHADGEPFEVEAIDYVIGMLKDNRSRLVLKSK